MLDSFFYVSFNTGASSAFDECVCYADPGLDGICSMLMDQLHLHMGMLQ